MNTGEVVRDTTGRTYQIGPLDRRGLWSKSFLIRQDDGGGEFTLTCPLGADDFQGDVPASPDLLSACREAVLEQGRVFEGGHAFMPPLQGRCVMPDGSPGLILPCFTTTLQQRLTQGVSLAEVLSTLLQVVEHLRNLSGSFGPHGNLQPSNVLLNERGDVFLADPATRSSRAVMGRLYGLGGAKQPYLPPEVTEAQGEPPTDTGVDSYAICMMLYQAALTPRDGTPDGRQGFSLPRGGLDKAILAELRDRVQERLQEEDSNQRFHARAAERLAALLNRALSREVQPSPPFRFRRIEDLRPRLEELLALIRPRVEHVGRVILSRPPASSVFEAGEEVAFTVNVGTSQGVDAHDEISCGIAVFDAETRERIPNVECAYTVERHPSGRFRFLFKLMGLTPLRYVVRVAFAIRESGHPPSTTEAPFEVRAGPGYVPLHRPQAFPQPLALDFQQNTAVTELSELDEAGAPRPLSPDLPEDRPQVAAGPASLAPHPEVEPTPPSDTCPDGIRPSTPSVAVGPDSMAPTTQQAVKTPPRPELARIQTPGMPAPLRPAPHAPPTPSAPPPSADHRDAYPTAVPPLEAPRSPPEPAPPPKPPGPDLGNLLNPDAWVNMPLPGADPHQRYDPDDDDLYEPVSSPLNRLIDAIRGDTYMAIMAALAALILVLLFLLVFVKS